MDNEIQPENTNELLVKFHNQLDVVENLMNDSIRPLISRESPLDEQGIRQALETLERWAELYRNGLKASENVEKNGAEWLYEAHKRLTLTAEVLKKIDIKSEKLATKDRIDKAKYLQRNIVKIEHIIAPVIEHIKIKS